jgi:hypothetical protein
VRDQSERANEFESFAELVFALLTRVRAQRISALGANLDFELRPAEATASLAGGAIAEALLNPDRLRDGMSVSSSSLRLSLDPHDGSTFNFVVEPRFSDANSRSISVQANHNVVRDQLPDAEELSHILQSDYDRLTKMIGATWTLE